MQPGLPPPFFPAVLTLLLLWPTAHSTPVLERGNRIPLVHWGSTSSEGGPTLSTRALRNTSIRPVQIGSIIAAYGLSLVLVAITLLSLAKKRREHLQANDDVEYTFGEQRHKVIANPKLQPNLVFTQPSEAPNVPHLSIPKSDLSNGPFSSRPFSEGQLSFGQLSHGQLSHGQSSYEQFIDAPFSNWPASYIQPSPTSPVISAPGVSPLVDQSIVAADKAMAQQQLEEMYKHVMEHEEAKKNGIVLEAPSIPAASQRGSITSEVSGGILPRRGRTKPSSLNLSASREDKSRSRTSSILSALLSPKKKSVKGISISSPILTPMSGTFPRHESQEMSAIPPRHYAPPPPPPVPTNQVPFGATNARTNGDLLAPEISPKSIQTIDERIGPQFDRANHSRYSGSMLAPPTENEPDSAASEHSQIPLVGLPSSPKSGSRFPSLPSSPKPGSTFSRPNAPSAVRTNGALPLRAYQEEIGSPSIMSQSTKQTVFERRGPLSPGGSRTPFTANAMPYSPYQPFTPCVPVTPGLVTKEDRRRMKRMIPKTPTVEMVRRAEDIW